MSYLNIVGGAEITEVSATEYTFEMPEDDVLVKAAFAPATEQGTQGNPWQIGTAANPGGIIAYVAGDNVLYIGKSGAGDARMADFEPGYAPYHSRTYDINEVVVCEGVTNVGTYAIYNRIGFLNMTKLTLPSSLTELGEHAVKVIGANAFSGCSSLVSFEAPLVNAIDQKAFYGCTSLVGNTIDMHDMPMLSLPNVSDVCEDAFAHCDSLTTVKIGKDGGEAGTVHARAFEECSSLKEVILDVSVKVIDENAFKNCTSLNKIHIYGSCPSISQTAFTNDAAHVYITKSFLAARDGDDRLPHINDPHGYWYFGAKILSYQMINTLADERKTVYIDQTPRGKVKLYNYTSLGGYINWIEFSSSGSLWKGEIVEIINMDTGKAVKPSDINMEHLTYIEKIPGYSRTELYSFEMPSYNVKFKIKFDENPAESDYIGLDPAVPLPEREGQPWNIAADGTAKLQATLVDGTLLISSKVPRGHTIEMADFVSVDAPWYSEKDSIRRIVIEEGVTNIGSCAFLNCKSIESVSLPSTLTKIGRDAFAYSSVSRIDMPKSLNEIGKSAFYRCNLDVNFRSKPESMHANAFENASVCCYVDEAWLGVATVDELNDKSGKYQYGGDVKYVAVSGDEYSITVIQTEGGTVKSHYDKARQNTLVMLDVEPAPGYGFDRFTTTGTFVYYGDTSFVMPKNDVTLTPVFKKLTHYLWCYHVDGVSLDCEKIYWNYGDTVKINSHADPGYKLVEYLVKEADGERTVPVSDDGTFIMPDFDVHIFGESEKIGYTVTVKQAPEGFAFVNGGMGYDGEQFTAYVDDKITLDTIAVPHKKLKKWIIQTADGTEEITSDVFDMPASDVTITPVFDTDYKINVASGDGGKVECNTDYAFAGDTVTLTVISDPGYTFAGFEEKPAGLKISDDGSFVMPKGDVSLKAKFERNGYAITSGDDGNGALIIANTANYNEKVTFDASPFYGYAVSKVSVRKTDGSAVKVIGNSFTMPDCDIYVSAEFENVKHKVLLHVSGEEYGSATLTDVIAGVGDKVRFTVSTNTDCGAYMEISPWADISFDSGVYSFEMPPIETDIIINFYKIDGSQTYPWYVGDETPENVKAYIDGGVLKITGNGTEKMKNFPASGAPWAERAGEITGAQMTSVINVGDYAFAGLSLSDELTLDENVKTVGKCAFERCALSRSRRHVSVRIRRVDSRARKNRQKRDLHGDVHKRTAPLRRYFR